MIAATNAAAANIAAIGNGNKVESSTAEEDKTTAMARAMAVAVSETGAVLVVAAVEAALVKPAAAVGAVEHLRGHLKFGIS